MVRLAVALALVCAGAGAQDEASFRRIAVVELRDESGEQIDPSLQRSVVRRIEEARAWGADCVVFVIESYGGLVTASMEAADEIFALGREIETIAYVPRRAISGGAMLAIACRRIVMSDAATLGDSQAVYLTADGEMKVAPEKGQTVVAQAFRKYAEGNGRPAALAEAMVRVEMQVVRYRVGDGWAYERADGPVPDDMLLEREVVVRAGEIATFSAAEAVRYDLCDRIEPNLDALLASISAPDAEVRTFDWTWAERLSRWLLGLRAVLFLLGAGSLYLAMKTPGTGVPELLALVFFGLYFGAAAVAGFAGALDVLLFFAGLILIGVELFVLPGFGVAGFLGLALVLASLAFSALPEGRDPASPAFHLIPFARDFFVGVILGVLLVIPLVRLLPRVPLFRALTLDAPPAAAQRPPAEPGPEIGTEGVTETTLRPAGHARIAGARRDVVAEGGWVEPGTPVRVTAVRGNVLVVRPVRRDA